MILHRMRLRNYRGLVDQEVRFADTGVTIVLGDNETGKSSVAESLDLLLAYPDSSRHGAVMAAQPVDADVGPEVEAEFSVGDRRLVYWKRWLKQPGATLTVSGESREQLTGREAHERADKILKDGVDLALWRALRLDQGVNLAQADLADSRWLERALDRAAGAALGTDASADLFARVALEFGRFHTPGGQPNKSLKAAADEHERLRRAALDVEAALRALDDDVALHERLEREMLEARPKREAAQAELGRLEGVVREVEAARSEIRALEATAQAADARAAAARTELADRRAKIADLDGKGAEAERLGRELQVVEVEIRQAEARASARQERMAEARARLEAAEEVASVAASDREQLRRVIGRDLLRTRHQAVRRALTERHEAMSFLETCRIDAEALERIEAAHMVVEQGRAVAAAHRTRLRLQALADGQVEIDGRSRVLQSGETVVEALAGPMVIVVPGRLRLEVVPGATARDLEERLATHEHDLARLLGAADVGDVTEARDRERLRLSMVQRQAEADRTLVTNLRDWTPEEIVEKLERYDADIAAYASSRAPERPMPDDEGSATAADAAARAEVSAARAQVDGLVAELGEAGSAREEAQRREVAHRVLLDRTRSEMAERMAELADARSAEPDERLAETAALREREARAAHRTLDGARERLAARDPETVLAAHANAGAVLDGLEARMQGVRSELDQARGRLEKGGERGLHDELARVRTELSRAEAASRRLHARAAAARLLHSVMSRHRDDAKRRYREPLRARVEQLGRIVFGDSFAIDLADDLRIAGRTLEGVTVPFASLSTGAREQLCVIHRLACASLVSVEGGAPVIFDDALGYSDPGRLRRLGAVLHVAGRDGQVILLTCMPERYEHVGGATVVTLAAQRRGVKQ